MATNLSINQSLLEAAVKVGGLKTKRETVDQALKEFIQKRKVSDLISLFGTIEYDADYDHKKARRRDIPTSD